jgi:meso-butanediol dehydrogenase/(S,S)-butanediol dehydrogenase/diacetyl reductase
MGRATALLFAQAGATVVGCGRSVSTLEDTKELAARQGLTIHCRVADAADWDSAREWVNAACRDFGGIDILYNNGAAQKFAPIGQMEASDWHECLRELDIVFFPTQAAWPHLIERGGGSIVNISSTAGLMAMEGVGCIAHGAAKGGVISMTRQIAMEGAPHWIRCNAISPGPVRSPNMDMVMMADPGLRRVAEGWPLLSRIGEGLDVAYAGLFLASDEASWITGINLPVEGGMTAKPGHTEH